MELYNILIDFSNVPSEYKRLFEWDDRYFTTLESAQSTSWEDRVQGGCNVVVEYKKDPEKAREDNILGDWVEVDEHRAI